MHNAQDSSIPSSSDDSIISGEDIQQDVGEENSASSKSAAIPQDTPKRNIRLNPATVPYVNDTLTYASRRREITLLITLLDEKKAALIDELRFVDHCTKNSDYPNINFVDPTTSVEE